MVARRPALEANAAREMSMWPVFGVFAGLFLMGLAAGSASAQQGSGTSGQDWLRARLAGIVRENAKVADIERALDKLYSDSDLDGGGVSQSDHLLADRVQLARERAREVGRVLERDLDGDGRITRQEVEIFVRPEARQLITVHGVKIAPTHEQIEEIVSQLTEKALSDDTNKDGVLSFAEMQAGISERLMKRSSYWQNAKTRVPLLLDKDGDGTVSPGEYLAAVRGEIASIDKDGNGVISASEAAAFSSEARVAQRAEMEAYRREQEARQMRDLAKSCGLPVAKSGTRVHLVGAYTASALSDVSIGGPDVEVNVAKVVIAPGDEPLYVVLTSYDAVVWQFTGATGRVQQAVVQSIKRAGKAGNRSGVMGLAADKVHVVPDANCLRYFSSPRGSQTVQTAARVRALIESDVHEVVGAFSIGEVGLPGRQVTASTVFDTAAKLPATGAGTPLWSALKAYSASGLVSLATEGIVTAHPVRKAEVLGHMAGLAQLVESGALQVMGGGVDSFSVSGVSSASGAGAQPAKGEQNQHPREFRIVKPMRFPPGLTGAHRIKFLLKRGVKLPEGDAGQSCVLSEDTGERLAGNGPC